ncbi:hypothetical protein THIOM_003102, partial [Candidatus Thiomargarita nelsonii]
NAMIQLAQNEVPVLPIELARIGKRGSIYSQGGWFNKMTMERHVGIPTLERWNDKNKSPKSDFFISQVFGKNLVFQCTAH